MFSVTARTAAASRVLVGARRTFVSSSPRVRVPQWTARSVSKSTNSVKKVSTSSSRYLSTTASSAAPSVPAPVRDFFLDNLGKFFLGAIAAIVLSLVRSSYGTSNQQAQVHEIEEASALDPLEIDTLRQANQELTPDLFRLIQKELSTAGVDRMTYEDFVVQVRTILRREKGAHCTIGMGFLLDRVVIAALQNGHLTTNNDASLPVTFWLTVLSLAMNGPVPDRIRVLYEILEAQSSSSSMDMDHQKVTLQDVITMVGYLQETCQLSPDKQVVPTDVKYPTQQYKRGAPEDLVKWGEAAEEAKAAVDATVDPTKEVLDIDAFAGILRSKSVCAWGECYHKKKYVP